MHDHLTVGGAKDQARRIWSGVVPVQIRNAVLAAGLTAVQRLLALAAEDRSSPLYGCTLDKVTVAGGRIQRRDDPSKGDTYKAILSRSDRTEITVIGDSSPGRAENAALLGSMAVTHLGRAGRKLVQATRATVPTGAFVAHFVEVRVDPMLGVLRISRVVSAVDAGRVLNEKLARSQIIGGVIGGIGQTLFEEISTDEGSGRIANATFADYLIPVNADVPDLDVVFVGAPDSDNAVGVKGIGEAGLVGIAAAISNAIHHATGKTPALIADHHRPTDGSERAVTMPESPVPSDSDSARGWRTAPEGDLPVARAPL